MVDVPVVSNETPDNRHCNESPPIQLSCHESSNTMKDVSRSSRKHGRSSNSSSVLKNSSQNSDTKCVLSDKRCIYITPEELIVMLKSILSQIGAKLNKSPIDCEYILWNFQPHHFRKSLNLIIMECQSDIIIPENKEHEEEFEKFKASMVTRIRQLLKFIDQANKVTQPPIRHGNGPSSCTLPTQQKAAKIEYFTPTSPYERYRNIGESYGKYYPPSSANMSNSATQYPSYISGEYMNEFQWQPMRDSACNTQYIQQRNGHNSLYSSTPNLIRPQRFQYLPPAMGQQQQQNITMFQQQKMQAETFMRHQQYQNQLKQEFNHYQQQYQNQQHYARQQQTFHHYPQSNVTNETHSSGLLTRTNSSIPENSLNQLHPSQYHAIVSSDQGSDSRVNYAKSGKPPVQLPHINQPSSSMISSSFASSFPLNSRIESERNLCGLPPLQRLASDATSFSPHTIPSVNFHSSNKFP